MDHVKLPLLMHKREKKKDKYVVPTWNHLYTIVRLPLGVNPKTGKPKYQLRPILDKYALKHKKIMEDILIEWKEKNDWKTTENQKVVVHGWVYWNDAREKDCHNLDKLFMDAMNGIIYDDDSNALLRWENFEIDREDPRIELSFEILGEVNRKGLRKTKKKKEGE